MNEPRWLKWVGGLILAGSIVAVGLTLWNLTVALESQRMAVERADATLAELEEIAGRLDAQTSSLERQAEETTRARGRFEAALQLLLDEFEIEQEPFHTGTSAEGGSQGGTDTSDEPEPEPEPEAAPGKSGDRRSDDNSQRPDGKGPQPSEDSALLDDPSGLLPAL